MAIWHTSDWHLEHRNIINLSYRAFPDIAHMGARIIDVTNNHVKENDWLFYHGDFALPEVERDDNENYIKCVKFYLDRLICKNIFWIGGNHDRIWLRRYGEYVKNIPLWKLLRWRKQCVNCLCVSPAKKGKCIGCKSEEFEWVEGIYPMGYELRLTPKICSEHNLPENFNGLLVACTHYSLRVWNKHHRNQPDKISSINLYGHSHGSLPGVKNSGDVGWDVWGRPVTLVEMVKEHLPAHNKTEAGKVQFPHH